MARRGSFGRTPRAQPSLTSTIIAIAREMQAARDRNIVDAWRNGGQFEGQPATDAVLLAYYRDRLKGIDKNDPQYDTYKLTVDQTEYSIAESKITTAYAQSEGEAADDTKVANFYLNWAKRIPKDTEFYRVLQRDAAQFVRSAKAKLEALAHKGGGGGGGGGGGSRGPTKASIKAAAEAAYQTAQNKTQTEMEFPGQYLTNLFTQVAQDRALIGLAPTQSLQNFDPSDPAAMLGIINEINTNPAWKPVLDQLKQLDPHFSGTLTVDYYTTALTQQQAGLQIRLDRAKSSTSILKPHKADATKITKDLKTTSEIGREANAWPIEQSYQNARATFLKTWMDPTSTPDSKLAAWKEYSSELVSLANDPKHPPDDNTRSRLLAEVNGDGAVDSLAESFTGLHTGDHTTTGVTLQGDIAETHTDLAVFQQQHDDVAAGKAVWAQGSTNSDGTFVPGNGNEIGATTPEAAMAASPVGSVLTYIPQDGAPPIPVYVAGKPIMATIIDGNGNSIASENPNSEQVGTAYTVTIDGVPTQMYAYAGPDGRPIYTKDPPWGEDVVQSHDTGSALQLTVRLSGVPTAASVAGNPNFTVTPEKLNQDGTVSRPATFTVNPSAFVLRETDPSRALAGPDPSTDSVSPTVALLMGSPDGRETLTQLQRDPSFRAVVDGDLRRAAGMTQDPATGIWLGGDQQQYFRSRDQTQAAQTGPMDGVTLATLFDRLRTFMPTPPPTPRETDAPLQTQLPADRVAGTDFAPLGTIFTPGTTLFAPVQQTATGLAIKTEGQIVVPQAPKVVTPTPVVPQDMAVAPVPPPTPAAPIAPTPITPPVPVIPVAPVPPALVPPGPTDTLSPPPQMPRPPNPAIPRTGQRQY